MRALLVLLLALPLFAGLKHLSLKQALALLEENNLEIKAAKYEEAMKYYDHMAVKAKSFGSLDFTFMALRSNDAGNVFGFKIQSREASFADFGFSDFLGAIGQAAQMSQGDFERFTQSLGKQGGTILAIEPKDLNYPKARNHFVYKFTYKLPLYTGGMLSSYRAITKKMYEMSQLDTKKLLALKRFEVKKTFYNIALVNSFIANLYKIRKNVVMLKKVIKEMKKEGYALLTDLMEVDSKLAEVDAMLDEAKLNKQLAYYYLSFLLNSKVDSIIAPRHMPKIPVATKEIIEAKSLDIAKAKLGLSISKDAVELAKAKFKPTIGAFAEYGFADNKIKPEHISKRDFYTVGVQLKWNLFNGGGDKAAYEKAKSKYLQVATQVELAKKGIWLKVQKLKAQIKSLQARVRSYTKQYRTAHRIYLTYKEKYKEGLVSITELLIKQSNEIQILMQLLKIKNERNEKILKLQEVLNS